MFRTLCAFAVFHSAVLASSLALADSATISVGSELSVDVGSVEYNIRYEDLPDNYSIETDYLRLAWYEALSDYVRIGFQIGRWSGSQDDFAITEGADFSGSLVGLALKSTLPLIDEHLFLELGGTYSIHDGDGGNDTQDTDIEWRWFDARAGLVYRLAPVSIGFGYSDQQLAGKTKTRGDINATTDFAEDERGSAYFNLDYQTDASGHIGLSLEQGAADQIKFYFQRFF